MPINIAINGFGRIGRAAYKIIQDTPDTNVVAVNDLTDAKTLLHLLKYDTAYGRYEKSISLEDQYLVTEGKRTLLLAEKDPLKLPWGDLKIDVVLECTGRFEKDGAAKAHITAGARKAVLSAPASGEGNVKTYLVGVNDDQYAGEELISNASCTTNCISPVMHILKKHLGIRKAAMSTIHALTNTQNLVDGPHKDLRRARASGYNIIPTTTGAAISTTKVIPSLAGKFDGLSLRVPIITGSLSDITALVERNTTVEEINSIFLEEKDKPHNKGVLDATFDPIVSSDVIKSPYSVIVDLSMTKVIDGDLVKILAWYDNEWGYSQRLVEIALLVASK